MLLALTSSFILGFAISAVPGAVFFETIRRTLHDKTSVYSFMAGNFAGILVIIAAVFLGLTALLSQAVVENAFYFLSGLLLVMIGVSSVVTKPETAAATHSSNPHRQGFLTGLLLAVANPLSIVFWASLVGTFVTDSKHDGEVVLQILFVVIGAAAFFIILITVTSKLRAAIKPAYLVWMARVFGFILIAYGLRLWANLLPSLG